MLSFLRKKRKVIGFKIDSPEFWITPDSRDIEFLLQQAEIEYHVVTKGYITFKGCIFGSDIPLMIGVHYNPLKVEYIEIFRPIEYYQAEKYNIDNSYADLSQILRNKHGRPLITYPCTLYGFPREQWKTPFYTIDHYIMDRFGPEEHLHINFYKR